MRSGRLMVTTPTEPMRSHRTSSPWKSIVDMLLPVEEGDARADRPGPVVSAGHGEAAADAERLPRDVSRRLLGEEGHRVRDVVRGGEPPEGNGADQCLDQLVRRVAE